MKKGFTLAEGATHVAMSKNIGGDLEDFGSSFMHVAIQDKNNRLGFTLAELLITLGIIGVVAALTMPSLITKQRNKIYEIQFKTAHSLVSQALDRMAQDKFDLNMFYCSNRRDTKENVFIRDFAQYFQIVKSDFGDTANLTSLGYNKSYFNQPGPGWNNFNADSHNNGVIFLKNGMMIASSGCWWRPEYIDFIVDTNGIKGPNKFGFDVFYFQIGNDNKLYPSAGKFDLPGGSDENMKKCCNFQQANTCHVGEDTGTSCSLFAVQNVSPHDNTKGYWESLP